MLVGKEVILIAEVPLLARLEHGLRQRRHFRGGHAIDRDRHQHCAHLIVGDVAACVAIDERLDFTRLERPAAALPIQELVDAEVSHGPVF